jgi:hypothetical protein
MAIDISEPTMVQLRIRSSLLQVQSPILFTACEINETSLLQGTN